MEDAAKLPAAFLAKHGHRVVVGFARMDDHRPVELARQPQLRPEHRLLHVARREIVVIVETDLADRARRRRRRKLLAHDGRGALGIGGELVRLMRVDADREARPPARASTRRACAASLALPGFENDQRPLEPGVRARADNVVEIRRERLVGEVAMAVDHIGRFRRSAISFRLSAFSCDAGR